MQVYIPGSVYESAMNFERDENAAEVVTHSIVGLVRHGLLQSSYTIGSVEHIQKQHSDAKEQGIIVSPTTMGAEMFFWGLGVRGATGYELASKDFDIGEPLVDIIDGSCKIKS